MFPRRSTRVEFIANESNYTEDYTEEEEEEETSQINETQQESESDYDQSEEEDEEWLTSKSLLSEKRNSQIFYKPKIKMKPLEHFYEEFDNEIRPYQIQLTDLDVELHQRAFQEGKQIDDKLATELQNLRKSREELKEKKMREKLLKYRKATWEEEMLRERWARDKFRQLSEESREEFKRKEDLAKLKLAKMHADLRWKKEAELDQRTWKLHWYKEPQHVDIRICQIRAVKEKLPEGKYVMLVSVYDRLGGMPIKFEKCKDKFKKSTAPVIHKGRFVDISMQFDDTIRIMFPSEQKIHPRLCFVFELFCLRRGNLPVNQIVAWGAFPAIDNNMDVVKGCFKAPLIRGEIDKSLHKYSTLQNIISNKLKYWLANLYFEVKLVSVKPTDNVEFMVKISRDWDEEEEEAEEPKTKSETNSSITYSSSEGSSSSISDLSDEESESNEPQLTSMKDVKNVPKPETQPNTASTSEKQSPESSKSQAPIVYKDKDESTSDKITLDEPLLEQDHSNDISSTSKKPAIVQKEPPLTWFGRPKFSKRTVKFDDSSLDAERVSSPSKKKLRPAVRKISFSNSLFNVKSKPYDVFVKDPDDSEDEIDYYNYKQSVWREALVWNEIPLYQQKLKYLSTTLIHDLGFNNPRKLEFWFMVVIAFIVLWLRSFPHYIGQWIWLSLFKVALSEEHWYPHVVILDYREDFQSPFFNISFIASGTVFNMIIVIGLILFTMAAQTKYVCPTMPSIWYRIIWIYAFGVSIDPILIFIVETVCMHWRGEAYRLPSYYQIKENSPVQGICIDALVFAGLIIFGTVLLYYYTVKVHLHGRVIDVYKRIHSKEDMLFIPHDLEISLEQLKRICQRAKEYRGTKRAETRMVVIKELEADHTAHLLNERLHQLLDMGWPDEYFSLVKLDEQKTIASDILKCIEESKESLLIENELQFDEEELRCNLAEYFTKKSSQKRSKFTQLEEIMKPSLFKPAVWLLNNAIPDITLENISTTQRKKFIIQDFSDFVDAIYWEREPKEERIKEVKRFLFDYEIVPRDQESNLDSNKNVVGCLYYIKKNKEEIKKNWIWDTYNATKNWISSLGCWSIFKFYKFTDELSELSFDSDEKQILSKKKENVPAKHIVIYNFSHKGEKKFWRHFVRCPDGTVCEAFYMDENGLSKANLLNAETPDYWIHKATLQLEREFAEN